MRVVTNFVNFYKVFELCWLWSFLEEIESASVSFGRKWRLAATEAIGRLAAHEEKPGLRGW